MEEVLGATFPPPPFPLMPPVLSYSPCFLSLSLSLTVSLSLFLLFLWSQQPGLCLFLTLISIFDLQCHFLLFFFFSCSQPLWCVAYGSEAQRASFFTRVCIQPFSSEKDKLEADKTGRFYECASKVFGDQTGARQAHVKTLTSLQYLSVLALKPNAAA